MDWDFAILRKRRDLAAVLGTMVAMLAAGAAGEGRCVLLRVLRPAESALRRLIFIMAKRIKRTSPSGAGARPMPDFACFSPADPARAPAFRLIDRRKSFNEGGADQWAGDRPEPRMCAIGIHQPFGHTHAQPPEPQAGSGQAHADPAAVARRVASFRAALDDLPREARRMARLIERRRAAAPGPLSVGPLRPGLPPGVDKCDVKRASMGLYDPGDAGAIALDCHMLARDIQAAPP